MTKYGLGACIPLIAACAFIIFSSFVVLKVQSAVEWSWPRVFIPLWIFMGLVLLILSVTLMASRIEKALGATMWLDASGFSFTVWYVNDVIIILR